jgi:hypothetical protein
MDQCIYLAWPAIDVTMILDSTTVMCDIIMPHPSPSTCCTTPLKLAVIDKEDAHRSTSCLHHSTSAPKTMP